ncbi:MAG: heme-binding protein [Gammaproteobacteria bacterium]|nr:heme-binding protein [Gammaproteobacteria bacterium]
MSLTFNKQSITADLAQKLIDAAEKKTVEIDKPMVIAILDESGHLKAFRRMDGSALISIEVAQNKAYTAIANAWGHSTHEIYDHIKKNPATLIGIPHISRYTVFGGGFPIKIDEQIVGGIGVSGGNVEQDISVAKAALVVLE